MRKLIVIVLTPVGVAILWLTLFNVLNGGDRMFVVSNLSDAVLDDFSLQGDLFYYNRFRVALHETFRIALRTDSAVQVHITFTSAGRHYDTTRAVQMWPLVHNRLRLTIDSHLNTSLTATTL